jgi:hypothetical protein
MSSGSFSISKTENDQGDMVSFCSTMEVFEMSECKEVKNELSYRRRTTTCQYKQT